MHYQLCPKCDGQGIVSKPPWIPADIYQWTTTQNSFPCPVCNGAKVLLVPDKKENVYLDEDYLIKKAEGELNGTINT